MSVGSSVKIGRDSSHGAATARASVVMARKRPVMRSAGVPTRRATAAVTSAANNRALGKARPTSTTREYVVIAPRPRKATWPRESWPVHPVSTVKERASRAKIRTRL